MKKIVTSILAIFAAMVLTSCQPPKSDVRLTVDTDATIKELVVVKNNAIYEEYKDLCVEKGETFSFSILYGNYDIYVVIDYDPKTSIYEKPSFYPLSPKKTYLRNYIQLTKGESADIKLSDFGTQFWAKLY